MYETRLARQADAAALAEMIRQFNRFRMEPRGIRARLRAGGEIVAAAPARR